MGEKLSLLIADDEDLIRARVRMMVADSFLVDEAGTADSAKQAATRGYDAILLDIVFPDGNGIDICREIKELEPHSTVLISSSLETVDAWNKAFQAGADGYLEKRELLSMDPRKLILTISNLVERNRLRKQTEETNRRQTELMSVLSHDVRAPFQALLGTIDLLRKTSIPADAAAKVETLHRCASDQLTFINSLLELLRLESTVTELRLIAVDINLPVNQCLQTLGVLASQKDISLTADLQPDLPKITCDIGRIAQVVNNLVSNAVKFTPREGKIAVETRFARHDGTAGVEILVHDTGIGVKPENLDKIFQRFRRSHTEGTEGEKGTGLGLSICRQIVQLHGGTIELEPARPQGTIARVWLPASPEPGIHRGVSFVQNAASGCNLSTGFRK